MRAWIAALLFVLTAGVANAQRFETVPELSDIISRPDPRKMYAIYCLDNVAAPMANGWELVTRTTFNVKGETMTVLSHPSDRANVPLMVDPCIEDRVGVTIESRRSTPLARTMDVMLDPNTGEPMPNKRDLIPQRHR